MKRLVEYCKPFFGFMLWTLIIKTVGTVMDLFIPYLLGYILDEVVPHCTRDALYPVFLWGALMLLCALVALGGNMIANQRTARFSAQVVERIRRDTFRKILSLSSAQTDSFTVPSLVTRMSSDSHSIYNMLNMVFRAGLRAPILLAGGVIITLSIEPVLALSFVSMIPVVGLIIFLVSKHGIRLYKDKQKKVDRMIEKIRDTFTGIRVIKALSKLDYEKDSFQAINEDVSHSEEVANITLGLSKPLINLFLNLGSAVVVGLGAYRVFAGYTTPGKIISFMSYFTIILNATLTITRIFTICTRGLASADRIAEVLDEKEDLLIRDIPKEKDAPYLEFRNVTFSYNKTIPTVENISFTLNRGETLGIIGGTGSGKTTLIQLLLRFYDPDEGAIFLEGRDLRSYPRDELSKKFGVVFQNDFLLAGTVESNICFERDLSREDVRLAAESAQALPFIQQTEKGFEHELVTKGANLSGGQRQRLLVSRALAANPEILILDDASSALDYKTDAELRRAIRENHKNSTSVIVAQRISSVKHADLILVLEHGELIGKGTDETLSQTCEVYQEIAHSQMGEVMA